MSAFLQELAHVYLRNDLGTFAMLECYADDSGTHDHSRVIVWGGVMVDHHFTVEFENAWNDRLQKPCEDRPALKKGFHSADLSASRGEFQDYNQAERDLTRRNFRQVIIDTQLSWISYGISRADWDEVAKSYFHIGIGTAEHLVFGSMILKVCDAAHEGGVPVSFQFDKGREVYVAPMIQPAVAESKIDDNLVSHGFSSVQKNVALQAADLVAHETYRYFTKFIDDTDARADIHLEQLAEGAYDVKSGWFGRKEIEDMCRATDAEIKKIERDLSS